MSELKQKGYTLIELLLYVAIIGGLLISVTMFYGVTLNARVKSQSISEVEQQGALALDYITQTIRNATSITAPAAGATGSSLTLVVPTGVLSPTTFNTPGTVLGYNVDGGTTDSSNSNVINATKFTATASGTIDTLYAYVGATIGANPNNKGQMAIYSGATPSTLLASSASVDLTASSVNAFPISSVSVTNGQTYWLAYNTNGTNGTQNNLRYHIGAAGQSLFTSVSFGTWPGSWSGSTSNFEFSMYALIGGGGTSSLQITEGAASAIPLTNSKVEVTNLTFKNLSRSGTPGIVQVSVTLARINDSNRNEYDYEKTFVTSAALRWP
jgi:hypothetical protein